MAIYLVVTYILHESAFSCALLMNGQYIKVDSKKSPILEKLTRKTQFFVWVFPLYFM